MLSNYEDALLGQVGQYSPEGYSASNRGADFTTTAKTCSTQSQIWKNASLKAAAHLVGLGFLLDRLSCSPGCACCFLNPHLPFTRTLSHQHLRSRARFEWAASRAAANKLDHVDSRNKMH